MCLPKANEVCNDTVSPVYIKHDGKIDHWLTDIKLQECKNKTLGMFIKWRHARAVARSENLGGGGSFILFS